VPFAPARQLVSGPDVGGGYLLQLSQDREPELPGFTYHLQEGGLDAAAPPADSVEWLGFERSARSCMFGGNRCWERHFPAGTEPSSAVRNRYNRFRFVLGPLLEQRAGRKPVPLGSGLRSLIERIAGPMEADRIPWWISGDAAGWVRGGSSHPEALDLTTTEEGSRRLAILLADSELWPTVRVERPGRTTRWEGAAFLGTFVDGVLVRWTDRGEAVGASGAGPAEPVAWEGLSVPVAPLDSRDAG
jgi:hypothetical protein